MSRQEMMISVANIPREDNSERTTFFLILLVQCNYLFKLRNWYGKSIWILQNPVESRLSVKNKTTGKSLG
jgi:hypothetical protein